MRRATPVALAISATASLTRRAGERVLQECVEIARVRFLLRGRWRNDDHGLSARFGGARIVVRSVRRGRRAALPRAASSARGRSRLLARRAPRPGRRAPRRVGARFRTGSGSPVCARVRQCGSAARRPLAAGNPRRKNGRSEVPPPSVPRAPLRVRGCRQGEIPSRTSRTSL